MNDIDWSTFKQFVIAAAIIIGICIAVILSAYGIGHMIGYDDGYAKGQTDLKIEYFDKNNINE